MKSIRIRSYYSLYFPAFSLNTDQNNSEHGYFLQSGVYSFPYCYYIYLQNYFQLIRWKIRFHNQHIMWCNFPKNQNNQKDVFFFSVSEVSFCLHVYLLLLLKSRWDIKLKRKLSLISQQFWIKTEIINTTRAKPRQNHKQVSGLVAQKSPWIFSFSIIAQRSVSNRKGKDIFINSYIYIYIY